MTTPMKLFRMLSGIFASMVAILGGGIIVPFTLWIVYNLNLGIRNNDSSL
jgi:hypothetical protein